MNKQYRPNIIRGGIALPLGNNYYFMRGRKHKQGGIDVGKDLEVEDGEIMKVSPKEVKVFSSVPFLNGRSPVEKLLGGENPNKVFAQQERFKKVNKIKDDGTKAQLGKGKKITTTTIPESEQYAVTTPDGQRRVFNSKEEAQSYVTANTPKGYSLYDTTNYGSNIDKSQTAILNRNTEREIEKATEQEKLAAARLANRQQNNENAKEALNAMPVIGDAMDLYSIGKDIYNKNYSNAGIGLSLLALPNIIEKPLKYVGKGIKRLFNKTSKSSNNVKLTDNFNINSDNKSYEELVDEYIDSYFEPFPSKFNKTFKKSNNNIDNINSSNKSYEELAEDYADAWFNNQYKYGGKMKNKNNIDYIYNKVDKSDKNFAKRLRDQNRKHITNWEDTTQISTHKLGVATDKKSNHYIYPEVQEVNGQLVDYTRPPFNRTAGMINAEKTGDTIRVNSIDDGIKFTQEYKNRYMNKKQLGGKANIYRVDANGKSNLRMNISTGDKSKARKKALLGLTTSDYINLGTNVLGSIGSALINANTLNKMKYTKQPIPKIARKLKTSVNINPQLDTLREQLNKGLNDIDQNTASSATALNRKNRLRLANIMSTNQLFANKENLETDLINKDRLKQQDVANTNIDNYNKWLEGKTAFENTIKDKQSENYVSAIQNISQGVSNTLSNIEKRKATQNNIIAILAANPNVNPEYLRVLGADWVTDEMIANWKRANNK